MGRKSRWPDELWSYCAGWRAKSWTYEKIHRELYSPENKKRFGYDDPPSTDTISRQIKGRGLVAETGSPLPRGELEVHYRELRFLLLGIRERIELPHRLTFEMSSRYSPRRRKWCGFGAPHGRRYEPRTPEEEDVDDSWITIDPQDHPQYPDLLDHLLTSLDGSKIVHSLTEVIRASKRFIELQGQIYSGIARRFGIDDVSATEPEMISAIWSVFDYLDRTVRQPSSNLRVRFMPHIPSEELKVKARDLSADLKQDSAVEELSEILDRIGKTQSDLKTKLGSATQLWRVVQAGEGKCKVCSGDALRGPDESAEAPDFWRR